MRMIELRRITKSFPTSDGPMLVLDGIDLDIPKGAFVTVFGPNGCGKSTMMNILAGLDRADSGEIITHFTKDSHAIGMVFQDYRRSLMPWRNVEDNILYPLRLAGFSRAESRSQLSQLLEAMEVAIDLRAHVYELSGGQAQTIALLRALIVKPDVLLCDEPTSALDYQARISLGQRMMAIAERLGLTVLLISHDLDEALYLGDRTVFLSPRPAKVLDVLEVPLGRPREITLQGTAEFAHFKARALDIFTKSLGGGQPEAWSSSPRISHDASDAGMTP